MCRVAADDLSTAIVERLGYPDQVTESLSMLGYSLTVLADVKIRGDFDDPKIMYEVQMPAISYDLVTPSFRVHAAKSR